MPQIVSITELQTASEISRRCHASAEPLFITKDGNEDMVVMSYEAYREALEISQTDLAVRKAEEEHSRDPVLLDAETSLASLRRKHFG